jgi:hypothetical protein
MGEDVEQVVARRLDTQLHDTRWLPDAAYLVHSSDEDWLVLIEGQSVGSHWPSPRATRVLHSLLKMIENSSDWCAARLLEVRLEQRHRTAGRRRPVGLVHFEPSNRLLDVDPRDAPFCEPEWWVFTGFAASATPQLIAERVHGLHVRSMRTGHESLFPLALLLGLCGRVRFPNNAECEAAVKELAMNQTQPLIKFPGPGMTAEERAELEVWMEQIRADMREKARLRHEEEARLAEEDARRADEDARRADEDARRADEDARRADEDARRADEDARLADEAARLADEAARLRARDIELQQQQETLGQRKVAIEQMEASVEQQQAAVELAEARLAQIRQRLTRQSAQMVVTEAEIALQRAQVELRSAQVDRPDSDHESLAAAMAAAQHILDQRRVVLAQLMKLAPDTDANGF